MLDSLVRVSRRGKENHFASITSVKIDDSLGLIHHKMTWYRNHKWNLPPKPPFAMKYKPMLAQDRAQRPHRKRHGKYAQPRHWFPSLPFQQFQVLFNSLFKVLCIFPSRYLFAIGLPPVFSFRWNLPPTWSCNPKQLDSSNTCAMANTSQARTGVSPSMLPFSKGLGPGPRPTMLLQTTIRCWVY